MTPTETERLLRRLQDSMDASHRLHQEVLTVFRQLLREQQRAPEPTPPKPSVPEKWAGHLYLDTQSAAERMDISPRTLEQWRVRGGGPPLVKLAGGVRYDAVELEQWLGTRRRRSTSDSGGEWVGGGTMRTVCLPADALLLQTDQPGLTLHNRT